MSTAERSSSRREFLTAAGAGVAGAVLSGCAGAGAGALPAGAALPRAGADAATTPVKLGVASYSLRELPRERAIELLVALRTPFVNIKSFHLPYDAPPDAIDAARREFAAAGLRIVGGGTITFERDTDEDVGRYFAYAKRAGMPLIVGTGAPGTLPRVERFARRYDIRVAIHNHGPEDRHYPSPYDVLRHVAAMDPRMGLCMDLGHSVRAGADVVQAAADAGPRLLDIHAKDLRDPKDVQSQCVVGEGVIPIAALFRQLQAMRYDGFVNLEYEIDAKDPLPGMQRSLAFMRGVNAGLAAGARAAT
ncbi:MAG: sugar phosphate isomerase/epimerase family protein [Gemmatimonadaceae bacterium]